MQSGHPFLFLLMSLVFIFDGGMGLIKVSLIRYLKMKNAFKNIQFPFHDHMRKRLGIPVKKIVVIFIIAQILFPCMARDTFIESRKYLSRWEMTPGP